MPSSAPPPTGLSSERVAAVRTSLERFSEQVQGRGRAYASQGQVGTISRSAHGFEARVRGTRAYTTTWTWTPHGWRTDCTCPMQGECKHAYALGLVFLRTADGVAAAAPAAPPDLRALEGLRTARTSWERMGFLRELLRPLQRARPGVLVHTHLPPFREILEENDPDLLCWRLAQALPEEAQGWLPSALEPYRQRADLDAHMLTRRREAIALRLARWSAEADAETAVNPRSLRFVLDLAPGPDDVPTVEIEGRLTTPRTVDQPRTIGQLEHLRTESLRKPGLLPEDQMEMLEAFLNGLASGWNYGTARFPTTTAIRRVLEVAGGTPAVTWTNALDPDVAARCGLTPGGVVSLGSRAARIVPTVRADAGGGLALDLEARWPDGRSRPLHQAYLARGGRHGGRAHPDFLFCNDEAYLVGASPPADLVDELATLGGLPVEPVRHTPLLGALAQRFPTMREALAPHLRVVPGRAIVALDLASDDDDLLVMQLFAAAEGSAWAPGDDPAPEACAHEYGPARRWEPIVDGPAGRRKTVDPAHLHLLDTTPLSPTVEWLARTGARNGDSGWEIRLTAKRLATFDEAWGTRPDDVRWFATSRAQRLLEGTRSVRAKISVRPSGVDWFGVTAQWESEDLVLSEEDLTLLRRATGKFVRLPSGWVRRETNDELDRTAEALADLGLETGGGEQRVSVWQLAQARPESLATLAEIGGADSLKAIEELRARVEAFEGLPAVKVPPAFKGTLRGYQQTGVDFLAFAASLGLGAILADDMGLGKTIQALAWIAWLREQDPELGPVLVVCPASVVHNWQREAARFTPKLAVVRLTGAERRTTLKREATRAHLWVTNYALMRRDIEELKTIDFGAVILDEAQNIKNPNTDVTRAARELKARHRLALTGTPLENRALDLWSILSFASPGFLGSRRQFTARYDPVDAPPAVRRLLAARLRPVLLRRMKSVVAKELPPRTEERRDCELTPVQKKLYLEQVQRARAILAGGEGDPKKLNEDRFQILAILTRMRQICDHPALVGAPTRSPSGKFDALWELLEPLLAEGHKVLLFSQFVECLALVARDMNEREIPHHMLTGKTNEKDREAVVQRFTDDPAACVFLVSLKAGGTGLNLTAASYVVLFDPWWNPAVEAQAIDRTHRIGQTRKVTAYRLLTRDSIEEKIWELQQKKATLAKEVLGEEGFARSLSREDLEWLIS